MRYIVSSNWVTCIIGAVFVLLIAAATMGVLASDTYWANPPLREAEAETVRIENAALKEQREDEAKRQRDESDLLKKNGELDLEARKREIDDTSLARQERAKRGLVWLDHWNRFGIFAVAVVVVALLIAVGVRVVVPPVAKARQQEIDRLAQQQQMEYREMLALETKRLEQLRENRWLEQVRLERARVAARAIQPGDDDTNKRNVLVERRVRSSSGAGVAPVQ